MGIFIFFFFPGVGGGGLFVLSYLSLYLTLTSGSQKDQNLNEEEGSLSKTYLAPSYLSPHETLLGHSHNYTHLQKPAFFLTLQNHSRFNLGHLYLLYNFPEHPLYTLGIQ